MGDLDLFVLVAICPILTCARREFKFWAASTIFSAYGVR